MSLSNIQFSTVMKLADWAERLPESVDFIDYWYNLSLSKTKYEIESDPMNNINAFHWTRWQEDFEEFVDNYKPKQGKSFGADRQWWYAAFTQYLVYAFQLSSKQIAEFYGKEGFISIMDDWFRYHCFGVDHSIERFADEYGLPSGVAKIIKLHL